MMQTSNKWTLDIETDGLDPTVVWCVVVQNICTKEVRRFVTCMSDKPFMDFISTVGGLVMHNGLGYDVPVLEKLLDVDFSNIEVEDTLIMSHLFGKTTQHSLRHWGETLGYEKDDFSEWDKFSWEMLDYCQRDVEITTKLYRHLSNGLEYLDDDVYALEYAVKKSCVQQEKNGWHFDIKSANNLVSSISSEIRDLEFEVRDTLTPLPKFQIRADMEANETHLNTDGSFNKRYKDQLDLGCHYNKEGEWGFYEYPEFNLGSREQIGEQLIHRGWEPTEFTETGKPKVNDEILEKVYIPEAQLISKYLNYSKIKSFLVSWLNLYNEDTEALHGSVRTIGTVTHRMSSSKPNMQQIPSKRKAFGTEVRGLFKPRKGNVLVGADLSGLELRCLAHYMGDRKYIKDLVEGDIHIVNMEAAGIPYENGAGRDVAKTFIYAYIYGGGDNLIGRLVGGGINEGRELKGKFATNIPSLERLRLKSLRVSKKGYINSLDGRRIYVRKPRSALNFLLQSAGSIIAKRSWMIFHEEMKKNKPTVKYKQLGVIHDEIQIECKEQDAEMIGNCLVSSMEATTEYYKLKCPITGEYKIGSSWADTH